MNACGVIALASAWLIVSKVQYFFLNESEQITLTENLFFLQRCTWRRDSLARFSIVFTKLARVWQDKGKEFLSNINYFIKSSEV